MPSARSALAQGWRDLWKSRWSEPMKVLRSLESRLDCFSLFVDNQRFKNHHLKLLLAYAAECRVKDLQINLRCCKPGEKFIYHLPLSSPLLMHLSLRNINISDHYCKDDAQPFRVLEVIRLHSVTSSVNSSKVLALCPHLRILNLHRCSWIVLLQDCLSLCPFCYSSNFPYHIPSGATLADLYICFGEPIPHYSWIRTLPDDLSSLTVLTVCSKALKVASSLLSDGPNCRWDKMGKLPSLKELQLLMHGMEMDNLTVIYLLLKSCHFSNLERIFVQIPATSDVPLMDLGEEVSVELLGDSLVKVGMVIVMNFNWWRFEVQLVSLLLRKATFLQKLLLVSPNVDPLHVPGVQEVDLLILKEALSNGRIIVSESDDLAIQPFHPKVFIKEQLFVPISL